MSDPTHIPAWLRIDDRLTTSGQPDEEQLRAVAALGVRHVVNLALHSHERALPDEMSVVTALGMRYVHLPVAFEAPMEEDYERFCVVMKAVESDPVHIHCIVNARVSAFLFRYRRDCLGVDETIAREAMERVWKPGGAWATFVGDAASVALPHRYRSQSSSRTW